MGFHRYIVRDPNRCYDQSLLVTADRMSDPVHLRWYMLVIRVAGTWECVFVAGDPY